MPVHSLSAKPSTKSSSARARRQFAGGGLQVGLDADSTLDPGGHAEPDSVIPASAAPGAGAGGRSGRRPSARGGPLRLPGPFAGSSQLVAHHVPTGLLERAIERRIEQVLVVELHDVGPPDHPQPEALAAPGVELAGVVERQGWVGRDDAAAVAHRLALALLAEDLERLEAGAADRRVTRFRLPGARPGSIRPPPLGRGSSRGPSESPRAGLAGSRSGPARPGRGRSPRSAARPSPAPHSATRRGSGSRRSSGSGRLSPSSRTRGT